MIGPLISKLRAQQRITRDVLDAAYPQLRGRTGILACMWEDAKTIGRAVRDATVEDARTKQAAAAAVLNPEETPHGGPEQG